MRPYRPAASRQRRVGAVEDADEVDREHPLPLLRRRVGEEAELVGAGVVDEDVERAGRLDRRARRLQIGDVELERVAVDLAGHPAAPSTSMSPTQTSAPSAASRAAIAAPMPLAPPVTTPSVPPASSAGEHRLARS